MVALDIFRKKSNDKAEDIKLDSAWLRNGKLNIPEPPAPTASGLDFPDHPNFSDESEKLVLPPVEDDTPQQPEGDKFEGLDAGWKEFLKQNAQEGAEESQETPATPSLRYQEQEATSVVERQVEKTALVMPAPRIVATAQDHIRGPLFVEASAYQGFIDEIGRLRVKLQLMDSIITKVDDLREKEVLEIKRWHQGMDEMRRRFLFIDDALFERR